MNAITPSMIEETTPRVIASWIGCTAPMRERTSPTWRFSKFGRQTQHVPDKITDDLKASGDGRTL